MRFRNAFLLGGLVASLALAGCSTTRSVLRHRSAKEWPQPDLLRQLWPGRGPRLCAAGHSDSAGQFTLPPSDRRLCDAGTAGTIVVNTPNRFLYYVLPGGKAVRYGIGVGKQGFAWQGRAYIAGSRNGRPGTRRRKWPCAVGCRAICRGRHGSGAAQPARRPRHVSLQR